MSENRRKICVFSSTRAEYGLLRPLMQRIASQPGLALQVIVTGSHLSEKFGSTYRLIEADGFVIDRKIEMPLDSDSAQDVTRAVGIATAGLGDALRQLEPDAVVILGDRYELLAIATAALIARIPLLHIGGGEVTEGAMDDAVRHAVSKLSWLHFAATESYRNRLIQLGEDPKRIFNVGAIGLDNVYELELLARQELSARLQFDLSGDYVLATYHPVTLATGDPVAGIEALIAALAARPNLKVVFTGVNADPGYQAIDDRIRAFAAAAPKRVHFSVSLGQLNYLSVMKYCAAVVGNSSSGIAEAPSMGVPTVNIGDRQRGRLRVASLIDCAETLAAISAALDKALSPEFRAFARNVENPYGRGGTSAKIVDIISRTPLQRTGAKSFQDLPR